MLSQRFTSVQASATPRQGCRCWAGMVRLALALRWVRHDIPATRSEVSDMCRNIRQLHHFEPPATTQKIRAAATQYVRKIGGTASPSRANQPAYERAVDQITAATQELLEGLTSRGEPRNREVEAAKARAR